MATRWGIASAGKISHDFVCALKTLPKSDHEVTAVAARSLKSAQEFAERHSIPTAVGSYEELAKLPSVEIVYIGTINTNHYETAKLMLENGKHVLCEKPLCMNQIQTSSLLEFAKSKKLFFMEAVWSRCFPVYKELKEMIKRGDIGEVREVIVQFGFPLDHVARVNSKELGGGTILDIGIYTLQFAQHIFDGLKPTKFIGGGHLNSSGVDDGANCIIYYGDKMAVLTISAMYELPNTAFVIGSKGRIQIPMFWCPDTIQTLTETKKFELPASKDSFNFHNSVGLSYEAEECRKCIKQGLLESPVIPHSLSLELSVLMDTWRKHVGVVYNEDL